MKTLSLEKMEKIEGGDYCGNMWITLTGGGFQGSNDLYLMAWGYYGAYCVH